MDFMLIFFFLYIFMSIYFCFQDISSAKMTNVPTASNNWDNRYGDNDNGELTQGELRQGEWRLRWVEAAMPLP